MSHANIVLITLSSVWTATSINAAEQSDSNCAVGVVFAALVSTGHGDEVSLEDVRHAFTEIHQYEDAAVPMSAVSDVLLSFGINASQVRFDTQNLENASFPIILLIGKAVQSDYSQHVGHYLLLTDANDEYLSVLDPDNLTKIHKIPRSKLGDLWEGYAILLNKPPSRLLMIWTLFLSIFVVSQIVSVAIDSRNQSHRRQGAN
jgi:ABC-type bacteriocin/lantibiotic exporter with double-glycine peptidase domain